MKFFLGIACVICYTCGFSQNLAIDNTGINGNPVDLVANYLVGGGINVFNVSFSGSAPQQIGYYTLGSTAVGTTSGIAMSTGSVMDATLHNASTSTGTNIGTTAPTDADVIQLASGVAAHDWFILEFDFIPTGNQLSMQYVFASEEYNEYVCANEADVFAVLVSGPGFSGSFSGGAKLASVVPSSTNAVGINSVNNGVPGTFGTAGGCVNTATSPYYNANTDTLMEFDGYTDLMSINETVECDKEYHMRIILVDLGSKEFDSGLFLAAKSLGTNGSGVYNNSIYNDSIIVEGCGSYEYVIYNNAGFTNQTMNVSITGSAQNGIDYSTVANPIVLPAGDNFYTIRITPLADGVTEGTETVTIAFDMVNLCGDTSHHEFTIYIQDENPLVVSSFPANQSICVGVPVTLLANVSGGISPYAITWNGVPGNNLTFVPTETTTYACEIYDQAGCAYYNNFTVTVYPIPIADAGPDFSICVNQQQNLGVNVDGGPHATYLWKPAFQLNSTSVQYPTLTATATQTYTVTASNPGGCADTDTITVTVLPLPTVNAGADQTVVYLQTSAGLNGGGSGTPIWSPEYYLSCINCFMPDASPQQTTTYTLTVTGANGCVATDQVDVVVETPTEVFVPTAFSPNGDGNNDALFLRCYTAASIRFIVYDIWGQPIFETNNPSVGWDGTVKGMAANIGLYTWTADVVFVNGEGEKRLAGEVNLVR